MASLIPSLITGALPRLGVEPGYAGGFEKWLSGATLVPRSDTQDAGVFRFSISDPEALIPYLAFDFERFSLAAAESFLRATQRPSGALSQAGWRLLELYYSAFFAAHAIIRSQGAGVAVIGATAADRIGEIAALYGSQMDTPKAGSWFYRVRLDEEDDAIIELRSVRNGLGVHDAFWREFCAFVKMLANEAVQSGLPDSAEFLVGADEISGRIRVGGDGSASWLAKVRNEINYKQGHAAWYPEPKGEPLL